ncbi:hypothetical protein HU751_008005 [Pseudomonas sp. BW13M1]|uniref:Uncharacterized protein n=1 Tax=Pseudomonas peradeniyensis TaxID=2745488 RepID=A0A923GCB6_9PSED|nr:hypothetical protein [Pseudomonas peradeniyensis]MBV4504791.1 hypothetical protein [Pseudomonas peradeniyensis]
MKNKPAPFWVKVNQIRGTWMEGAGSVNTAQYLQNVANGMTKENAALNTWAGRMSQKYGYTKVLKVEDVNGVIHATFGK